MLKGNISLSVIAKKYNTSITTISRINRGEIYQFRDITYPISLLGIYHHLSIDKIKDIISYLINTNMTQRDIASCLDVTRESVKNINTGQYHKSELEALGFNKFPIRTHYKP